MPSLIDPNVSLIQVPFNILDQRWDPIVTLAQMKRNFPLKVHVRSIYLQGLLLSNKSALSVKVNSRVSINDLGYIYDNLDQLVEKYLFTTRRELCWSQVINRPWIDGIIVGAEQWCQMEENIQLLHYMKSRHPADHFGSEIARDVTILDPSMWCDF